MVGCRAVPPLAGVTSSLQVRFNIMILPTVNLAHKHITVNPNFLPHASENFVVSQMQSTIQLQGSMGLKKIHKDHLLSEIQGNVFTMSSNKIEKNLHTLNIQ